MPRNYTTKALRDKRDKAIELATSLDKTKVSASGTKPAVLVHLEKLRPYDINASIPPEANCGKMSKGQLVYLLVKVRKAAFKANTTLSDTFAKEADEVACGGKSTFEERQAELQRSFYLTDISTHNPGLTDFRVDLTTDE